MRRSAPLWITAIVGCQQVVALDAPVQDPSFRSALVIIRAPGEEVAIQPLGATNDRQPPIPAGNFADGTQMAVVYYRAEPEALFFELFEASDRTALLTRPIPAFDAGFQRRFGEGGWDPLTAADLADLRIPAPDELGCFERGGCYLDVDAAKELDCKVPCTSPLEPVAATLPTPPDLGPCLPEWSRRSEPQADFGALVLSVCDPPATANCSDGQAQWVGASSCAIVGSVCPNDWPGDLPTGRPLIHVRPGAPAGGTGGPADPYATLEEAAAAGAGRDPVLVLAAGAHRLTASLTLGDRVSVVGACAFATTIEGPPNRATILASGVDFELRDVTLRPGVGGRGLEMLPGAAGHLLDAVIAGPTSIGVWVNTGAELDVDRVLVHTTTIAGIEIHGEARLADVVIKDTMIFGVLIVEGSAVIERLAVRRVSPPSNGLIAGVFAYKSVLTVADSLVEGCTGNGIKVSSGRATISDTTVRDTVTDPNNSDGLAIGLTIDNSEVDLARIHVDRAHTHGLLLVDTKLRASDLIIEGTVAEPGENAVGHGFASETADVTLARVWLRHNDASGVNLSFRNQESLVANSVLSDLIIEDTRNDRPDSGDGLAFSALNQATVDRVLVVDARRRSLGLFGDAKVRVSDLTVVRGGIAARLDDDSRLTLHRALFDRPGTGFCLTQTSSATADNVLIGSASGTGSSDICGLAPIAGVGLVLADMSKIGLRQTRISSSADAAISIAKPNNLLLEDGWIDHNNVALTGPAEYLRGILVRTYLDANRILFVPLP